MLKPELQSVADAELLRITSLLDSESSSHSLAEVEGFLDRWSADSPRFDPDRDLLTQGWRQTWADNGWVCSACVEPPGESRQASELLHAVLTEGVRLTLDSTTERQRQKYLQAFYEAIMDYLDSRGIELFVRVRDWIGSEPSAVQSEESHEELIDLIRSANRRKLLRFLLTKRHSVDWDSLPDGAFQDGPNRSDDAVKKALERLHDELMMHYRRFAYRLEIKRAARRVRLLKDP